MVSAMHFQKQGHLHGLHCHQPQHLGILWLQETAHHRDLGAEEQDLGWCHNHDTLVPHGPI